jgi:pimeloyl-ACP methyl ester carboxylesterase
VREKAVHFGEGNALSAILSEPSPEQRRADAPAIVLSNVGMHSRIGPYRMWVEFARKLADEGFVVLRFDQSGFGDSEVISSTLSNVERAANEQRQAIDLLESRGASGAVLVGFCSGVDGVHVASRQDTRVRGVVHLDGYAYPTLQFFVRRWTLRLLRGRTWVEAIERRKQVLRRIRFGEPARPPAVFDRVYPAPPELAEDLRSLVGRNTELLFLWSGGREHEFNHVRQLSRMLHAPDLDGKVRVGIIDRTDHLFSSAAQRGRLFQELLGWLLQRFAGAQPRPLSPTGTPAETTIRR